MTIFFYKRLTRNLEIRNTPISVLPNIWSLGQVVNTKFGMNVSNKILQNAAKCQGYSLYCFSVIKGKPTGGQIKLPHSILPNQIRVKIIWNLHALFHLNLIEKRNVSASVDFYIVYWRQWNYLICYPLFSFSKKHCEW